MAMIRIIMMTKEGFLETGFAGLFTVNKLKMFVVGKKIRFGMNRFINQSFPNATMWLNVRGGL
jgi:hypothetical protein